MANSQTKNQIQFAGCLAFSTLARQGCRRLHVASAHRSYNHSFDDHFMIIPDRVAEKRVRFCSLTHQSNSAREESWRKIPDKRTDAFDCDALWKGDGMSVVDNKELLLRVVTKLAATQLKENDLLIPFGATLNSTRKVNLLLPKSMKPNVTPDELSQYWAKELREAAEKSDSLTVCSCFAGFIPSADGSDLQMIFIHIEHAGAYSEDALYPYTREIDGNICFGERSINSADHQVFLTN
jgi:hypothetical protein